MNVEMNKEYVTRGGHSAIPRFRLQGAKTGVSIAISGEVFADGRWVLCSWTDSGAYYADGHRNVYDLMPLVTHMWRVITLCGSSSWCTSLRNAVAFACEENIIGVIRGEDKGCMIPDRSKPFIWMTPAEVKQELEKCKSN